MNLVRRIMGFADNRMNPIVVRELRQAVQSRFIALGLQFLLLILLAFIVGALLLSARQLGRDPTFGLGTFLWLFCILYLGSHVIVPLYAGVRLAIERSGGDLMFISTITPRRIIYGKLWSAILLGLVLFSAAAPFMILCYLMRGVDIPSILLALGFAYVQLIVGICFWLLWGSLPIGWPLRIFLMLIGVIIHIFFGISGVAFTISVLGLAGYGGVPITGWEFFAGAASIVVLFLFIAGLFLELAAAMLAPPSSNRMVGLRIFLTASFFLSFAIVLTWLAHASVPSEAMVIWYFPVIGFLIFFFALAICERDTWGARVLRNVPRNPLVYLLTFPFQTGAIHAIVWCAGLFILAPILTLLASEYLSTITTAYRFSNDFLHDSLLICTGLSLFTYAYGVSAALLYRYLFRNLISRAATWVLALTLLCVLAAFPVIFAALLDFDSMDWLDGDNFAHMANPFFLIDDYDGVRGLQFGVAMFWSVAITIAAIPWFIEQLLQFRPLPAGVNGPPKTANPFASDSASLAAEVAGTPFVAAPSDEFMEQVIGDADINELGGTGHNDPPIWDDPDDTQSSPDAEQDSA